MLRRSPSALEAFMLMRDATNERMRSAIRDALRVGALRRLHAPLQEHVPAQGESCSEIVQKMFSNSSENVQQVFRKCLDHVLNVFRKCLERVKKRFRYFQKVFRNSSENVQNVFRNC